MAKHPPPAASPPESPARSAGMSRSDPSLSSSADSKSPRPVRLLPALLPQRILAVPPAELPRPSHLQPAPLTPPPAPRGTDHFQRTDCPGTSLLLPKLHCFSPAAAAIPAVKSPVSSLLSLPAVSGTQPFVSSPVSHSSLSLGDLSDALLLPAPSVCGCVPPLLGFCGCVPDVPAVCGLPAALLSSAAVLCVQSAPLPNLPDSFLSRCVAALWRMPSVCSLSG